MNTISGQMPAEFTALYEAYNERLRQGYTFKRITSNYANEVFITFFDPPQSPDVPPEQPTVPTPEPEAPQPEPLPEMPLDPDPKLPFALTWSPPRLETPLEFWVGGETASVKIPAGRDARIRFNAPVTRQMSIEGGRNVVLIGGEIYIPIQNSDDITKRTGMKLYDAEGIMHVEGVYIYGPDLTEGIQIAAPNAIVQIQNVRVEAIRAHDQVKFTDNHPDIIQPWGGYRELRVDRLSGSSDYQGLLLKRDKKDASGKQVPTGPAYIKNTNINGLPTARYLVWVDTPEKSGTAHFENVWIDVPPQRSGNLGKSIWPDIRAEDGRRAVITVDENGNDYATWGETCQPRIYGRVTEGVPPGGDFVPKGVAGMTYQSPGYVEA